jgi:hypothetical protein
MEFRGATITSDAVFTKASGSVCEILVYVVDAHNHRVQKFCTDGRFLTTWGRFGDGNGELNMPWGIAISWRISVKN